MREHWTLDSVAWEKFDRSKLDPRMVNLVKAASLVEYNAKDYVEYLRAVFKNDPKTMEVLHRWGEEEVQHGSVLGRWAEIADPTFKFEESFERFRKGYRPPHFANADGSVRGSRVGELVARCVVECGTSSGYTAMRDATDEPVLKQIAGLIAADEFKHYRLFFDLMGVQEEAKPGFWRRLWIAMTRMSETSDDELAYAYYCANVPADKEAEVKYDRKACNKAYQDAMMPLYRRGHVESALGMVARAVGFKPEARVVKLASGTVWTALRLRNWLSTPTDAHAA